MSMSGFFPRRFFSRTQTHTHTRTQISVRLTHLFTVAVGWSSHSSFPLAAVWAPFDLALMLPSSRLRAATLRGKKSSRVLETLVDDLSVSLNYSQHGHGCDCAATVLWKNVNNCNTAQPLCMCVCVCVCVCRGLKLRSSRLCTRACDAPSYPSASICRFPPPHPTGLREQWLHHRSISLDDSSSLTLSSIKAIPADGRGGEEGGRERRRGEERRPRDSGIRRAAPPPNVLIHLECKEESKCRPVCADIKRRTCVCTYHLIYSLQRDWDTRIHLESVTRQMTVSQSRTQSSTVVPERIRNTPSASGGAIFLPAS